MAGTEGEHAVIYETEEDRVRQCDLLREFCAVFNLAFVQTPPLWLWDATLFRCGRVVGIAECKVRKWKYNYGTLKIDRSKIDGLIQHGRAILLVRITGPDFYVRAGIKLTEEKAARWRCSVVRRDDRNDPSDVDAGYEIPVGEFTAF